jgi:hypothetical protein
VSFCKGHTYKARGKQKMFPLSILLLGLPWMAATSSCDDAAAAAIAAAAGQ